MTSNLFAIFKSEFGFIDKYLRLIRIIVVDLMCYLDYVDCVEKL